MTSRIAILQTTPLLEPVEARLASIFDVVRWPDDEAARADILARHGESIRGIAGTGKGRVDEALLASLPNLEIVSSYSAGLDEIDTDALARRDIGVFNTSTALAEEVADLAHWLLMSVCRGLVTADRFVRAGKWVSDKFPLTRSVGGLKVGILGLGHIGKALARRLEIAGAEIGYHGRRRQQDVAHRYFDTLHGLADWCDALVVCCPATPETANMIDAAILDKLGPQGVIVNIARGSIVDEPALIAALAENRIAGAGLDVFADEPNVPQALIDDPRVVVLPHVGSATVQTRDRMGDMMIAALTRQFGLDA